MSIEDLLESIPAGVSLKKFSGEHVFINSIFQNFFQVSRDKIIGKKLEEISRNRFLKNFEIKDVDGLIKKAGFYDAEVVLRKPESVFYEHEHIRVHKSLIRYNETHLILTIVFDIRDRVKRERDLIESEERFRKVFELSCESFVWVDSENGVIKNCNNKFSELLEQPKFYLLHKVFFKFFRQPLLARRYVGEISKGSGLDYRLDLFGPDGRTIPINLRGVRIEFCREIIIHISIMDLTAVKKAESDKEELQLRLMTAAKLSLIGEMSAGLAHEINNPLMVMLGNVDLLEERIVSCSKKECLEEQFDYLKSIREAGEIINELINRMKEHIKKFQPDCHDFYPINDIVKQALDVLKFKNIRHKINVVDETDDTIIFCSKTDIFQVFTNLISNAVDEIKGTAYRDIRIFNFTKDEKVYIVFEDSGKGVDKAHREKIFNPFFTTKRHESGAGTGLGLSFCLKWLHMNSAVIEYKRVGNKTQFICIFNKPRPQCLK